MRFLAILAIVCLLTPPAATAHPGWGQDRQWKNGRRQGNGSVPEDFLMPAPSSGDINNRSNPYGDYLQPVGPSSGDLRTDMERSYQFQQQQRQARLQMMRRQQAEDQRLMQMQRQMYAQRQPQRNSNYYVPGQNSGGQRGYQNNGGATYNTNGEAVYGSSSGGSSGGYGYGGRGY